jgi:bifunctional UDP-N-acetylglucosamine pyrophosphorylase/glucosamine-1-phosphate N-acetyltransferase
MSDARAVILAAGLGKRMRSSVPKVLHQVCGLPMCSIVRQVLREAGVDFVVAVTSPDGDDVRAAMGTDTAFVVQPEPHGTGDAVRYALPSLPGTGSVLVLYGDTPLLRPETVGALVDGHAGAGAAASMLTAEIDDPTGYGRIVRGASGEVAGIVEQLECTPEQARIREINVGIYCFDGGLLGRYIDALEPRPPQNEYLLTDVVGLMLRDGLKIRTVPADAAEVSGVNSRHQLSAVGEVLRRRELARLMDSGVTVLDPDSTFVHCGAKVGQDTVIHPQSYLLRGTVVGRRCRIGPGAYLEASEIGDGASVMFSTVEDSIVGEGCTIGPYAHLRPGTVLDREVKVGNFAEIKNSRVGAGSKVSHHSYVGDADVGRDVNIGAGAVFVNYDGRDKHRSEVGDGAFIGCNVNLVSPVRLGSGAYVAAGSTITDQVPPESLAIARERQRVILDWVKRRFGAGEKARGGENTPDGPSQTKRP